MPPFCGTFNEKYVRTYLSGFIGPFFGVQRRRERIRADNHKDIIFIIRKVSNWKTILSTN